MLVGSRLQDREKKNSNTKVIESGQSASLPVTAGVVTTLLLVNDETREPEVTSGLPLKISRAVGCVTASRREEGSLG